MHSILQLEKVDLVITDNPAFQTRYDYNLTIMNSPKPATDNRFK